MERQALIEKYTDLSKRASIRLEAFRQEVKKCRALIGDGEAAMADYQQALAEYLCQKSIAGIYGRICADLGDS